MMSARLQPAKLKELELTGGHVSPRSLASLRSLVYLSIKRLDWTDSDTSVLARCSNLQTLSLMNVKLSPNATRGLAGVPHLEAIEVVDSDLTDQGLAPLAGVSNLVGLTLSRCAITDEALQPLVQLRLQSVQLKSMPLSDAIVSDLLRIDTIWDLRLVDVNVSDVGLQRLADLPKLLQVVLYRTRCTPEGAASFKLRRPHVRCLNADSAQALPAAFREPETP